MKNPANIRPFYVHNNISLLSVVVLSVTYFAGINAKASFVCLDCCKVLNELLSLLRTGRFCELQTTAYNNPSSGLNPGPRA